MKKGLLLSFSVLLLIACNNTSTDNTIEKDYVVKIDSLSDKLNATADIYANIDITEYSELSEEVSEDYAFMEENYVVTPEKRNFANYDLTDFRSIRKSLKTLVKGHEETLKAIDYSKSQLVSLKKSIENNELQDSVLVEYFNTEEKAVSQIVLHVERSKEVLDLWMMKLDTIHPKIKKEIALLKGQTE